MRRATGIVIGLIVLGLGGCGADDSGPGTGAGGTSTSGSGAASGDAVAWADKVCQSVESEIGTLSAGPQIDTSSPEAARDDLTSYLNDFGTALDRLIGGIESAGAPPVANGQQVVDETTAGLEQAKEAIQAARTKLDQVPINDPQAARQAFTEVAQDMQNLGQLDATESMENNPELKDAFDKAPTCQKLDTEASSAPATPTS
jgi:hypothetical protein